MENTTQRGHSVILLILDVLKKILLFSPLDISCTTQKQEIPIQRIKDICKCGLCLETYVDPKTLPCRHSFCSDCLENLVEFVDNSKTIRIKCPTCQESHVKSQNFTVSRLKTELTLVQMLDLIQPE